MKLLQIGLYFVLLLFFSLAQADCWDENSVAFIDDCMALANDGDVNAQSYLGYMYHSGEGLPQDYDKAVVWYRKAAEQGDTPAQSNLGVLYETGQGVEQDYSQAVAWYQKAAEQGDAIAQHNLSVLYENGLGVAQDYRKAAGWYRKAAEQGETIAQYNLGLLYYNGHGVEKDYAMAYMLWSIGGDNRYESAERNRNILAKEMTKAQLDEAEILIRKWMDSH